MKINRHGRAKVLTQQEIQVLGAVSALSMLSPVGNVTKVEIDVNTQNHLCENMF
ncbi:hypothetical protein [Anabaena sp. UHCC 0187]|uniref:hypothetical protein n=1 Tax=Anabaena sp. UHCC 0187 TaxID=2590018 RepID=UPI001447497B|nr:hypothetical protein [Anabaena sp. UHCC 0187]